MSGTFDEATFDSTVFDTGGGQTHLPGGVLGGPTTYVTRAGDPALLSAGGHGNVHPQVRVNKPVYNQALGQLRGVIRR